MRKGPESLAAAGIEKKGLFLCPAGCVLMVFQCCVPPRRSAESVEVEGLSLPASPSTGLHQQRNNTQSQFILRQARSPLSHSPIFTAAGESPF